MSGSNIPGGETPGELNGVRTILASIKKFWSEMLILIDMKNFTVISRKDSRSAEGNHYLFPVVIASDITLGVGGRIIELIYL